MASLEEMFAAAGAYTTGAEGKRRPLEPIAAERRVEEEQIGGHNPEDSDPYPIDAYPYVGFHGRRNNIVMNPQEKATWKEISRVWKEFVTARKVNQRSTRVNAKKVSISATQR